MCQPIKNSKFHELQQRKKGYAWFQNSRSSVSFSLYSCYFFYFQGDLQSGKIRVLCAFQHQSQRELYFFPCSKRQKAMKDSKFVSSLGVCIEKIRTSKTSEGNVICILKEKKVCKSTPPCMRVLHGFSSSS